MTEPRDIAGLSPEQRALLMLRMRRKAALGEEPAAAVIPRVPRGGPLPLSFAQQRLWFLDRWAPESPAYNVPAAVLFRGDLDVGAFVRALTAIVHRHETLRTTFPAVDGEPRQVIAPPGPLPVPRVDLTALPAAARQEETRRLARREAGLLFDLRRGPLLRARLLRLARREHVVLFNMHHIVSDGWSVGVLIRELSELYGAFLAGRPAALPPLPVQYADFAVWQRGRLRGEELERQLAYWRGRLGETPPPLELPTDRPRPAARGFHGRFLSFRFPDGLWERIEALGQGRQRVTPFMATLAGFAALLQRLTGQTDMALGTPVAGRNRQELEGLIGFFVNTLALRAGLAGDPTFAELLARTREEVLGAFSHQDLPFEKLVEELQPQRSLDVAPVFQVSFSLQNTPLGRPDLPGVELELVPAETGATRVDLGLEIRPIHPVEGRWEYATDLFDPPTVERMSGHFRTLLAAAVADPGLRLAELPLLSDAERHQLLLAWNDTEREYERHLTVHGLFDLQAERAPDAVAVVAPDLEQWTYAGLARRSAWIARRLRAAGVGAEAVVGLAVERSPDLIAAMLGIARAGGAYLPLDPAYPEARLTLMLDEAAVRLVVAGTSELASLPAFASREVLDLETGRGASPSDQEAGFLSPATPDALVYVMYTSGSTGGPKGVAVPHRGVLRLARGGGHARLDSGEVVLQIAPASFDASTLEIWGALLNGGKLVMMPPGRPALDGLAGTLTRCGVTTLHLTSGLFQAVVDERLDALSGLRQLLFGGDVVSPAHVRRAAAALPECELRACYGPTEVTTFTSSHPARHGPQERSVPIGRPIADTRVYVLDRRLAPVPVGVVGELAAGGAGLARGYLGRPDLTAERFVPDPCGGEPGARVYRTGDRVRSLPDGTLELLGRVDDQVKLRGFRVEPREVEAVLLDHPAVARAAVLVLGERESGRRLVAYVQAEGGAPEDLRAWLRERVPDFMVPSAVVRVPEMPLTPAGKVDRRALAALAVEAPDGEREEETPFVPLRGPVEEVLGGIWAEALGRERIGSRDGFFDLGGHSLLAIRVLSRVRQAFGVELPLRALFEEPTLSGLARRVERALDGAPPPPPIVPAPPIAPGQRGLPLSFAQQRLWFIDQLEPDSAVYNTPFFLRLAGELDVPALAAAFAGVVERHEVLRTTFTAAAGVSALQVIGPPFAPDLPVMDLGELSPEVREAEARRLATLEAGRPFDLRRGPVLRTSLLRLAAGDHVLLVDAHHIATDAWSMEILWREVSVLYAGLRLGRPAALPPLPVQYADFAVWQRGWLQGEVLESQLDYWRSRLGDGPPVVELPADRPRPAVQSHRGADLPLALPAAASAALNALARREGATPFMTLLALFVALLGRMTGQRDLPVGTPISGRRQPEVEGLVGFFLNTLVIRAGLPERTTFRALVGQVRTLALEAYAHQDIPFEKLVDELSPRRSLSHSPLFQVLFVLLHPAAGGEAAGAEAAGAEAAGAAASPEGLAASPFPVERGTSKFDLTLTLYAGADAFTGVFEYATDLFDRPTIARLAEHLETLASAVAAAPDGDLAALPWLAGAARHQLLVEWNDTAHPLPVPSLHQLFERQAERTPDAAAAVFGGHWLTYGELARRAGRLARHLRRLGIGPESLVGIGLDRSLEMVTGVLGVLAAGAAYVPLDPALPRERRAYMLESSGAGVLLTRSGLMPEGGELSHEGVRSVCLDGPVLDGPGGLPAGPPPDPGCLAYVLYTSGSTGRPKGVALPRLALSNLIDWHLRHFLGGVRTLQLASLSFDVSFLEMFACWGSGGTLLLVSEELRRDVPALAGFLVEAGVEKAVFPVVVLQRLAEEYAGRGFHPLPPLAEITTMGEQLQTTRVMGELLRRLGGCAFHNHYGPSESHVVTAFALEPDPAGWATHPAIGLPIANARVHLLDEGLAPVPVGVPGELAIGGVCLARGYAGRPDLTAERFVPDPFAGGGDEPGARLYRTGDKVRRLADGNLDFLGRFDYQVKVRGFRVEPEEVESVLGGCPGVRQTVVLARRMGPGDTRLVAYVVPEPGAGPVGLSSAVWRAFLRDKLPDYMVPSHFVELEALPLNANGKVDRRALPAPAEAARPDLAAAYVAPRTPLEETLAAIWGDVLGIERVGVEDDFFELGGHSLLATQAVSRVRQAAGVEVPLRALFEGPTIAELARAVDAARGSAGPEAPPLVPRPPMPPMLRTGELPLSFAQQRLWFLDRLVPDNPFYNMFTAVRLAGPVDVPALREACREIARRHEVLRTRFPAVAGRPVQAVSPEPPPGLPLIDLGGLADAARRGELERLAAAEGRRPFDLTRGPVFRASLLRLGETEHSLFFNVHHIASDGWSLGVLHRDLAALYGAFHRRERSPLPELPIQYADFAVWQRGWLQGEALCVRLDYWKRQLDRMPEVLELPYDRPRPAIESFRGAAAGFQLAAPLVRGLSLLARHQGATLSMVALAGFAALLARLSGRGDIPVGVAIAGRNRRETEELIGFFVNTLVLRTRVAGAAGFGELVARVRETSLGAYAHQDLPFEKLVEELAPDRDLGRNPLVQVTFGFHNFPRREVETGGLLLIPAAEEAVSTGTSKFDLSLHLFEAGGALQGALEYNLDLFDEPTARRFTGHLATLLAAAVEDPAVPPALLPLLSEAESHQLLVAWNDTASAYERDLTVHEVFGLQVAERPDAVAVVAGDEHLTYLGLAREARRLAAYLRALGVGPEDVVGIRAERSAGLPAALLGILQAGGAYLPLDPEAPRERTDLMLREAGVRVVLPSPPRPPSPAPPRALPGRGGSLQLAYVMYTSGSTGRPKGVAVPHRGVVRLARQAGYARLGPAETLLQVAPVSFDASTFEIWGALLNGGRLVMMPPEKPTLDGIGDALARHGVTTLHLTAGLFHAMVEERLGRLAGLRQLLTGGDVLSASHVRRAAASLPGCALLACYGPTEGTTFTSVHPAAAGHLEASVPLGRPIGNTRVLVLDRSLLPVPVGVAGDLAVGGDGLARGYLGRPDLTAERFVPDPGGIGGIGERLYLTGDRVRHLADGTLEFLGRFDAQVKVRGFRVEPAEIETHLAEHPAVRASAVIAIQRAHREGEWDRRLVAYVVPDSGPATGGEAAQVEAWTRVFDDTYRETPSTDATFDTVGWVSSATGLPLSREEMAEWVDDAVDRILSFSPRRVLEIGCGTGLLLFRVAPCCEEYIGTDISPRVLANVEVHLGELRSHVRLLERPADRFDGIEPGSVDLVILNSVVQYFPSADYLVTVLERAAAAVRPGGAIFLGDVRSLPLLDAFHAAVELAGAAPAEPAPAEPAPRLRLRAEARRLQENELAVAPALFAELARRLPRIGRVEVHPKRGRAHNELTAFRCQVVLRIGEAPSPDAAVSWMDWRAEGLTLAVLRSLLEDPTARLLGARGIPNARSAAHGRAAALLFQDEAGDAAGLLREAGEAARDAAEAARDAVDPQDVWDLAAELGWEVELGWADPGSEGRFEAVFRRPGSGAAPLSVLLPSPAPPAAPLPWSAYATDPLRGQLARRLGPELRAFLAGRLPDYMLPAAVVPLESLPLTPNGKVDRQALARLGFAAGGADAVRSGAHRREAPRTPTEERLAAIWSDLLKVPRVGAGDDFFELGGHSLLATQAISRVRDAFGVELPLRALFETPTVAGLAAGIDRAAHQSQAERGPAPPPPLVPVLRDRPLPLSFAQQRLWFLDRLVPDNPFYNIFAAVRLAGPLDVAALREACVAVARRHEVLRTTFSPSAAADGQPVQVIAPDPPAAPPLIDLGGLGGLPAAARRSELERLAAAEGRRPFDLRRGPVFRAALLRLAEDDEDEHSLFLNVHHIAADGWSMGVLHRDLAALYAAFARRQAPALPELPVQYADFAVWQRGWLQGEALRRQLDYWRRQLAGMPEVLELPSDHPRPAVESFRGGFETFGLAAPLVDRLSALADRQGATLSMVVLAGFKTLLARLTGRGDVALGMAIANRTRREIEDLIGFFVNTLVLRTDTAADSFGGLVARVRETSLGAYAHQDLPFEKLVEELAPERDLGRNPLIQVMFGFHNLPRREVEAAGLVLASGGEETVDTGTSKFDLTLHLFETGGVVHGMLEYSADLFDAVTARRLTVLLETLLTAAAAEPGTPPALLPLLGEAERHQLAREWNDAAAPYPAAGLADLFAVQADRAPDATAVLWDGQTLTYAGLAHRSRRLAGRLTSLDLPPEARVGLCLDRSPELIVGMLGILQAGAAYVPLDPGYPDERLALLAQDAGLAAIVAEERTAEVLKEALAPAGMDLPILQVSPSPGERGEGVRERGLGGEGCANLGEGLAYVIYTSGSTGVPKGVEVPQQAVARLVLGTDYVQLGVGDRVAQVANASFDAITFEVWGALLTGGAIVGIDKETALWPDRFTEALRESGVSAMFVTTALFNQTLRARPDAFAPLRSLLVGGESLDPRRVREALAAGPPERLLNAYGPTESTTFALWHRVESVSEGAVSVPIGRPIANTSAHVLDPLLQPVPPGVPGELCLGGDGLARGYARRPGLTAERFVPDPFGGAGARLYRTGDRVRLRQDGAVEFLGRFDDQVKVRGFRVEPGEIEARLAEHPAVRASAVLVHEEGPDDRRLVAYVVPGSPDAAAAGSSGLRAFLASRLPGYMVPAAFVPLDALPLTPNGKVDRRALARLAPAADPAHAESERSAAPRSATEQRLAAIFADLLKVPRVGAGDDFFHLGGHSLLATQAVSRVREAFGVELPLRALFENPTVTGLAAVIDEAAGDRGPAPPPLAPIVPVPRDRPLPPSFAQERLWFLERFGARPGAYNEAAAFRLAGRLDVAAFRWALDEIVRRHEALRTAFDELDGRPVQRIAAACPFDLPLVDLSGTGPSLAEVHRLATRLARYPFDLARGPLFRGLLLRLADADHAVLFAFHHVVFDGWSTGLFLRELGALYTARLAGEPSPLPPLPLQYADFAVWQRRWLQGEVLERQMGYWRRALAGLPPLGLPTDHPRPAAPGSRGGAVPLSLGRELTWAVRDLGRRQEATLFMVLLAAFQALLQRYTGEEEVAVGTPIANRNRGEIEGLIGFFVNMLVLRGDLSGDPGFGVLIDRAREVALGAFAHQDLPFEKVVEELQPERDLGHNPLFQVGFQVINVADSGLEMPELELAPVPSAEPAAKLDLSLSLTDGGAEIAGMLEYDAVLFERATAWRIAGHFRTLLAGAVADPSRRLSELPLLTPAEEHQLLAEWNDAAAAEGSTPFLDRFAAWARRTPEATALIFEDEQLTYGELARRMDELATALRTLGVGPEVLVGLCLEASLEILVAILAVWRAGGAYLPLDPSYPQERLDFMLADSGAPLVLTGERLRSRLPEREGVRVICPSPPGPLSRPTPPLPGRGGDEDNLAYVIYTSGSTGRPKGVAVTRRGLGNLAEVHAGRFGVGPGGRVLQIASFSFDASVAKIVGALGTGAALVQARRESWQPGPDLAGALARHEVSFAVMVTSLLSALPPESPEQLPALSFLATAGEACLAELVELWSPGRRFWNLYGPTEMTVACVGGEALPTGRSPGGSPDMGRPLPNCRAHVVDRHLRAVPAGVPGELLLQGMGLARCYLRRPELTAERFVPDPWSALWGEPGGRLYRSGDLVRRLPDGRLEFLGRIDLQVKVRGLRIELGEIEAALARHPAVERAAVILRDRRLVAFVVPRSGEGLAASTLRDALRRRLPEPMVPEAVVFLDRLPLDPNDKVDRRALERIALERMAEESPAGGFVPPRTPAEQVLAGIWAEVLGIGRVGAGDDFFALSGNSMLAAQVAWRVRQALGVELPLRRLFERATLAELAREIEERSGWAMPPLPPIERLSRDRPLPASFYQELGWRLQGGPVGALLNMPFAVRARGPLDLGTLHAVLAEIVRRHELLRSVFLEIDGALYVEARPAGGVPVPVIDLSALPEPRREELVLRLAFEDAARPFDLSRAPGFRAQVVRLGERDHALLSNLHHMISDGTSFVIYRRELWTLYDAFVRGEPSPLPELPIQPTDFAGWQRRIEADFIAPQLAWWRERLAGRSPAQALPGDRPRPAVVGPEALSDLLVLPAELAQGLRSLARSTGCTLSMVLTAAVQVLLHRYTGEEDITVGGVFAGRDRPELNGLIGLFLNTLPLRADLSGSPSFQELLLRVRDVLLEAHAHQGVPLPLLLRELLPGQAPDRRLLFKVVLNVLDFGFAGSPPAVEGGTKGLSVQPFGGMQEWARYDLALDVDSVDDLLICHSMAAADILTREGLAHLQADFQTLLEQVVADPGTPIGQLLPEPRHRPLRG